MLDAKTKQMLNYVKASQVGKAILQKKSSINTYSPNLKSATISLLSTTRC